jgi:cobalt-zinc-cadmium efflux system membrane fusion protein
LNLRGDVLKYIATIALLAGLMTSCSPTQPTTDSHDDNDHSSHDDHTEHENEIALSNIQIEKIGLSYGKLEERAMHSRLHVNGSVVVFPQQQAQASSLLAGRVERIRVKPGDFVQRGATLAYLRNPDLIDLQQDLRETEGALLYLEKEYERRKELLSEEVIAKEPFQQISSDRAQAIARKNGLTAKLKAFGISPKDSSFSDLITIKSPISGYIDEVQVNVGAYVEPMQSLFIVLDSRKPYLELKVFEKDIQWVKKDQKISFHLLNRADEMMEAEIFAIDQMLEPEDRSLKVMAKPITPSIKLLPGMFIEAGISIGKKEMMCLPESAIALDRKLAYIFVMEDKMEDEVHFRQVEVLLGQKDGGYVAVDPVEELNLEDEIVIKGAYYLMAQSKKGETVAGHSH